MHTHTVRKCDFDFLTEGSTQCLERPFLPVNFRHLLTDRSIPHISLHHVTRFEPITAAHFDQRYGNPFCALFLVLPLLLQCTFYLLLANTFMFNPAIGSGLQHVIRMFHFIHSFMVASCPTTAVLCRHPSIVSVCVSAYIRATLP